MSQVNTSWYLNPADPLALPSNLAFAYLLNEGSGTTDADRTVNANTGTFGNTSNISWTTNDATFTNVVAITTTGTVGVSTSGNISCPSTTLNNIETYTLVVAIKTSFVTNTGGNGVIVTKQVNSGSFPFTYTIRMDFGGLGVGVGKIQFVAFDGTTSIVCASSAALNDGNWHQIIGTRTRGSALKLYIDGVYISTASDTLAAAATQNSGSVLFGESPLGTARGWSGSYAYSYLYNTVFSDGGVSTGNAASAGSQVYDMFNNPLRMWIPRRRLVCATG